MKNEELYKAIYAWKQLNMWWYAPYVKFIRSIPSINKPIN